MLCCSWADGKCYKPSLFFRHQSMWLQSDSWIETALVSETICMQSNSLMVVQRGYHILSCQVMSVVFAAFTIVGTKLMTNSGLLWGFQMVWTGSFCSTLCFMFTFLVTIKQWFLILVVWLHPTSVSSTYSPSWWLTFTSACHMLSDVWYTPCHMFTHFRRKGTCRTCGVNFAPTRVCVCVCTVMCLYLHVCTMYIVIFAVSSIVILHSCFHRWTNRRRGRRRLVAPSVVSSTIAVLSTLYKVLAAGGDLMLTHKRITGKESLFAVRINWMPLFCNILVECVVYNKMHKEIQIFSAIPLGYWLIP
jgi:hypothetical protein